MRTWMGEVVAGRGGHLDHHIVRPDGAVRHVRQRVDVLRDEAGRVRRLAGVVQDVTEYARVEEALRSSDARFRSVVQSAHDAIVVTDTAGRITTWNAGAVAIFGYHEDEALDQPLTMLMPERYRDAHVQGLARRAAGSPSRVTSRMLVLHGVRKDGAEFPLEMALSTWTTAAGVFFGGVLRDITARVRAEEAIRASEARLALQYATAAVLSASATLDAAIPALLRAVGERTDWALGAFWQVDAEGAVLCCTHTWHAPSDALASFAEASRRIRFASGEGLPGRIWASGASVWLPDVANDVNFPRIVAAAAAGVGAAVGVPIVAAGAVFGVMEFFSKDTQPRHADVVEAFVTIGTHIGQFVERVQAEEAVRHQATHDALTGLPNRVLLHARVAAALDDAPDAPHPLALLLLDLDHFKEVNDIFGHEQGDALLRGVVTRLRGVVRPGDTVARLGGDEFAVLLPGADTAGAGRTAADIRAALNVPLHVAGQALRVEVSVGGAFAPAHGADSPTLLRHADVAMYRAKRGRTGYAAYDPTLDQHGAERLALVGELRAAIEGDALTLHYQPQVDLASARVCGVEALARWSHPEHGAIPPDVFIPLAEQTGLIAPLTEWVLREVVRQARAWQHAGLLLRVSANLSMWNLHDLTLPEQVAELLQEHGLSASWLRLELTESTLMADAGRALDVLTRLAALGVSLAVDDFGTGYSSLAYLKRLPVEELKIDKDFVRALATDETDAAIVASTVDLGHALGLRVVAEGIEDRATWDRLTAMGCDVAQGYYLSRPLPADALVRWLRDSNWAVASDGDAASPGKRAFVGGE